jgi:antitoxin CptB
MTDTTHSTDIELWRKRLRFRCWHRGSREADLMFGWFADRHLEALEPNQLERLEALLDQEDPDVWCWVVGREAIPPAFDHDVMTLLREPMEHPTPQVGKGDTET